MSPGSSTFTDFKKNFYSRISDFSVFDCQDFNLLKVVLDGLKVDYLSKGRVSNYFFLPLIIYEFILALKRIRRSFKNFLPGNKNPRLNFSNLVQFKNKPYLIIDMSGRYLLDENGQPVSAYFHNIINTLGKEQTVYFVEAVKHNNLQFDFYRKPFDEHFCNQSLTRKERELRKNLISSFVRLQRSAVFSSYELKNIRFAIENFFCNYRTWSGILHYIHPRIAYFDNHYHREGCLLALKENNIKTIELQHGLIAPEDIFYIFPPAIRPIKARAFFPDKILVYGDFWKERLLLGAEFNPGQIEVVGNYLYSNNIINESVRLELEGFILNRKVILITSQTSMHEHYINYTRWLANDLAEKKCNYVILLKPHPLEKKGIYDFLSAHPIVKIVNHNLEDLFLYSDIHISIYSTTLYDAVKFNIPNYALYVEQFGDYVNSVVKSGIAQRLEFNENPVGSHEKEKNSIRIRADYFYSDYNPKVLESV